MTIQPAGDRSVDLCGVGSLWCRVQTRHVGQRGSHLGALGDGEGGGGGRTCLDRAGVQVGGLDREIVGAVVGVGDLDGDLAARRQVQVAG
jgi:hypothetical protein